jgi:hypothetical protein
VTVDEFETWLDDPRSREAGTGIGIDSERRFGEFVQELRQETGPI